MALKPCRECGYKFSTEAAACPQCGAKPKQPMGRLQVIAILIFGGFVINSIVPSAQPPAAAPPPVPTLTAAEVEAKVASEARFRRTVRVLASIKAAMREPESLKWEQIRSNEDGSVVCTTYRARNGFGGMNIEHAAFAKGLINTSNGAWNKNCADKSLYEMKHAQYALK
jgi:hypothetical protein